MASNKKLSAIITIGGAITGTLKGAFSDVKSSVSQVGDKVADLTRRQKLLGETIQTFARSGRDVSNLRQQYAQISQQIDRLTAAQERLNNARDALDANNSAMDEMKDGILGIVGAAATLAAPIKAAMDFESTMAEVKKVVNADGTAAQQRTFFDNLGDSILKLTRTLPMTANEIGAIVAAAGQSGIENNDLMKFAEMAAKMGVAFDITADEAGQSMAELKTAFGIPLDQVGVLADKINYLGNTTAASAPKILEIVQRIGPLGAVAGTSSGQIAALGATLAGMGVQNEVAATGIKNFMLALTKGEAATKSQKLALKELGFGSKQVAGSMQKDAQQTMMVILRSIQRMPKARQAAIMGQLFGTESLAAIAPLLTQLDTLEDNFKKVGDSSKYAGSMQAEYTARAATTENAVKLFKNGIMELGITVGSVVLPALNQLIQTTLPYVGMVVDLAKAHPELTKAVVGTVAAALALKVAYYGLRFASLGVIGAQLNLSAALARMRVGFVSATIGARMLGAAMVLNPIGLLVAAIGVGVALIIKYWDQVKAYTVGVWDGLTASLGPVADRFSRLGEALGPIGKAFKWLGGLVLDIGGWFLDLFRPVTATKEQLDEAGKSGRTFGEKLAAGIELVTRPIEWLIDKLKWIGDHMQPMIEKANAIGDTVKNKAVGAWGTVKGWFGAGDDQQAGGSSPVSPQAVPAPPMMARGGQYTDNSHTTLQVVQRPDENQDALTDRIMQKMREEREKKQRSNMVDGWAPL